RSRTMKEKRSNTAANVTVTISVLVGLASVALAGLATEQKTVCLGSAYRCSATSSSPEQKALLALAGVAFIVAIVAQLSKTSEERAAKREAVGLAEAKFNR